MTDSVWPSRVAVLGVGLLGGSVALSLRRHLPDVVITGLVRDSARGQSMVQSGLLDRATQSIEQACLDCDCVVVATPVDRLAAIVIQAAKSSPEDCLITDVGSTKAEIVRAVAADPVAGRKFVAAHPIAGSEKSGAQHAEATLFDQKPVVITPGFSQSQFSQSQLGSRPANDQQVPRAIEFWSLCGGLTVVMGADEHDVHLASISHVPHLVSALVAKLVAPVARPLVGSGWRDITRVAAGDPEMWTAICAANRRAIVDELSRFGEQLEHLRGLIDSGDDEAVQAWLAEAKQAKDITNQLPDRQGV